MGLVLFEGKHMCGTEPKGLVGSLPAHSLAPSLAKHLQLWGLPFIS